MRCGLLLFVELGNSSAPDIHLIFICNIVKDFYETPNLCIVLTLINSVIGENEFLIVLLSDLILTQIKENLSKFVCYNQYCTLLEICFERVIFILIVKRYLDYYRESVIYGRNPLLIYSISKIC